MKKLIIDNYVTSVIFYSTVVKTGLLKRTENHATYSQGVSLKYDFGSLLRTFFSEKRIENRDHRPRSAVEHPYGGTS